MCYDYTKMLTEAEEISKKYDKIEMTSIGKSVMQRDIICFKAGRGEKKVFLGGAYHGLEYLTAAFLVKFIGEYCEKFESNENFYGYDVQALYNGVTLYVVPMVNPDGVDIAVNGLDIANEFHRHLIRAAGIHSFNNVWQANARGVDINHNFDANWSILTPAPAPTKHGGENAESEPETRAVTGFVRRENIDMLIAFHSQGGEIYYDFDGMESGRSLDIAKKMARESGYTVSSPVGSASFGGCKDWFIKEFGKEGFTIEMGKGKNPLPMSMLDYVYEGNARIALCAMQECI